MEIKRNKTGSRTRIRTKEKIDKYFSNKGIQIHDDADLLLEYIGKKADLEYSLRAIKYGRRLSSKMSVADINNKIKAFCEIIMIESEEKEIKIEAIRRGLKKLCPLWPIC
ncbi:hypothetical protein [uncultured Winogradskyella sp.]|uniref:hypothetical protein n=1 Tax=uncultured Winogradskyella sp. TaxID=395353 RepID=UPI0026117CCA|nr:hypothetical protein [uncultured Winogradskyella sp.]